MATNPTDNSLVGRKVTHIRLSNLLLDPKNPRFGLTGPSASQEQILDLIVEKFGVNDVLSSLAVNGYFEAEPLVCRASADSEGYVVVEGNRRLAACLIITGDKRALNQATRTSEFKQRWKSSGSPSIDPLPAIVFQDHEQEKAILSYLGVRHIAASQPWDSYAKAVWVAQVVDSQGLDIQTVATMIGDQHRTVNRLLEGYYLVQQLVNEGKFHPQDSIRRGRGSVTDYPFSWVYTVLGYATVRKFLELAEGKTSNSPLPLEKLDNGALLFAAMFGNRSKGRSAAVTDSRQLGVLASTLASEEKVQLLKLGKTIEQIETLTQPLGQRLSSGLGIVRETLRDLIAGLSEQDIDSETAQNAVPTALSNRRLAVDLHKKLLQIAMEDNDVGIDD